MKIRHGISNTSKRCAVCEAYTRSSKIYEEGNISIKVPVCDREHSDCHSKIMIKEKAKLMLRELKQEVIS